MFGIFKKAGGSLVGELMKGAKEIADEIFTNQEEKNAFLLDVYKENTKDRQSARNMYMVSGWLQQVFAVVFLLAWVVLTYMFVQQFGTHQLNLEDWQIALLTSIYTGVNIKLATIIDFLFGGKIKADKTQERKK